MYRRYEQTSKPRSNHGENRNHNTTHRRSDRRNDGYHNANHRHERPRRENEHACRREHEQTNHHEHSHNHEHERLPPPKNNKNPLFSFIPTSVYNPENGKILGFLSAEDLLLIAMILIFLDSEEEGDNLMVYALLYVLASEWIDVEKFFTKD